MRAVRLLLLPHVGRVSGRSLGNAEEEHDHVSARDVVFLNFLSGSTLRWAPSGPIVSFMKTTTTGTDEMTKTEQEMEERFWEEMAERKYWEAVAKKRKESR